MDQSNSRKFQMLPLGRSVYIVVAVNRTLAAPCMAGKARQDRSVTVEVYQCLAEMFHLDKIPLSRMSWVRMPLEPQNFFSGLYL